MEDILSILANKLSEHKTLNVSSLSSICQTVNTGCHLAIMNQPYLDNIIKGDKTIESRFSKVRCSPFRQVNKGDILIFKESSGGIIALSTIKDVEYYGNMSSEKTIEILTKYQKELTITPEFMEEKKDSKYASLMYIDKTITISAIKLEKIDRRAWITFEKNNYGKLF